MLAACKTAEPETEAEFPSEVVTEWNGPTELFLEYPLHTAGKAAGNWAVHLTGATGARHLQDRRA